MGLHRNDIGVDSSFGSEYLVKFRQPRFQNILEGTRTLNHQVFYEYDNSQLRLKPKAMKYFEQNHSLLLNSVILEWAKFLEKINKGLPMLISKLEGHKRKRASLERARKVLSNYFDSCFYCSRPLSQDKRDINVDHFIPWSYIYEDEMWNLVLSCRKCNNKKNGSLPPDDCIQRLLKRDREYSDKIKELRKSLLKLDSENRYEEAIKKHYRSCKDYGFTLVNGIDCH